MINFFRGRLFMYGVIFFLFVLVVFVKMSNFDFLFSTEEPVDNRPDLLFEYVDVYVWDFGKLVTSYQADKAFLLNKDIYLTHVKGRFSVDNEWDIRYVADSGIYYSRLVQFDFFAVRANFMFSGDAVVLDASELTWSMHDDFLMGKKGVRLEYRDMLFESHKFGLNFLTHSLVFKDNIVMTTFL